MMAVIARRAMLANLPRRIYGVSLHARRGGGAEYSAVLVRRMIASQSPSANSEMKLPSFTDSEIAFKAKRNFELLRTWTVFRICGISFVVRKCDALYNVSTRLLGARLTHWFLRHSFFNHFCAGENVAELKPIMLELRGHGVGGILDYAAEAKEDDAQSAADHADSAGGTVGATRSARYYDYKGEAKCDANVEIFLDAIRAVRDATPDGFAAIKLSGLGNPALLERMSTCLTEMTRLFKRISEGDSAEAIPQQFYCIDRDFVLDFEKFRKGWQKLFTVRSEEELREIFDKMDTQRNGLIDYVEFSGSIRLSEINTLVRGCRDQGALYRAALDEEEMVLYWNLVNRVRKILDLAQELKVRVMIDAEWTDIQPAIDHVVLHLQRIYNRGDQPIVFNTYQTYLKGMHARVLRDLERSRREGWRFGAKLVRGAYMVSEREKARQRGLESPICDTYDDTEVNFHSSIEAILAHNQTPGTTACDTAQGPGAEAQAEVLIATHNRRSVELTLNLMQQLNCSADKVYFGQLKGMADHLTFTLGANGYKAYKYVPYGPIDEVMPYLIRRTQENSAVLGSPGVQEERRMVTQELRRRLLPF